MPTKQTIVELKARLVGAQQVRQEAKATQQALDFTAAAKSFAKMEYAAGQTFRQLKGMSGVLRDLNQSLRARDGIQGFAAMRQEVEALVASLRAANEQMARLGGGGAPGGAGGGQPAPAPEPKEPRRLTFTRGVLQGAGLGEYFPEKDVKGLWWNALGRKAGQFGAGALSTPFTGAQGFSQMLGGLPVVGGFAQGMMGMGMGRAQEALGFRSSTQSLAYLGMGRNPVGSVELANAPEVSPVERRRRRARALAREGAQFDLSPEESLARAAEIQRAAGGTGLTIDQFRQIQSLGVGYGVSGEAAGGFMRAARTGGLRGQEAVPALQDAVRSGIALGLSGTDLTRYVEQMAHSLAAVVETGIPLDRDSLDQLSVVLTARGAMSPERAQILGQAFRQYTQQVAQTGPQTALDFAALQDVGGYQGGGLDDYVRSLENMESGTGMARGLERLVRRTQNEDLSFEGRKLLLSRRLNRMGMNVGITEAGRWLQSGKGGGNTAIAEFLERKKGVGDVETEGEAMTDPVLRERRARELAGLDAGERLLPAFEKFEAMSARMLTNFTKFSDEINKVVGMMDQASQKMTALFDGARSLLDWAYVKFGHGMPDPLHATGKRP